MLGNFRANVLKIRLILRQLFFTFINIPWRQNTDTFTPKKLACI